MPPLPRELRKSLEEAVIEARRTAESAATAALATLAVDQERAFDQMPEHDRRLRRALRAKSRQLGGDDALVAEVAYQHWHRMLFARFLAENGLLIHPDHGVGVSLTEIAELAQEEGESDPWVLAARYAARMLPAIFRSGDPILELRFAPEGRQRLEALLQGLPSPVFTSDDGLGWVYQFWQSEKKKEVNRSGNRIGATELPAVTQLFTEHYIVRFLLENTLGAWWAARHPDSPLLKRFTYLRFNEEGSPAARTYEGWPQRVAEVTVMDPCCGSGHFLTVAFEMLTAMRMEEAGLSLAEAGDAVIAENLFGLEIDARCTQIAAFQMALAAWRSGGYRELPPPNIACSGIAVAGQLASWKKLAECDDKLEQALEALHQQFAHAPDLGSLIDPRRATEQGHLFSVDYEEVAPLLQRLLAQETDPEMQVAGWAATGISRAASLLASTYTLVATNVPYLTTRKQGTVLREFLTRTYPASWYDLATSFLERCLALADSGGGVALLTPQNWLTLRSYSSLRSSLLRTRSLHLLATLGAGAFETISGAVMQPIVFVASESTPSPGSQFASVDCSPAGNSDGKAVLLGKAPLVFHDQSEQVDNPDSRIVLAGQQQGHLLMEYADCWAGIMTGDYARFGRCHWELSLPRAGWEFQLSTVQTTIPFGGREHILLWEDGKGQLRKFAHENRKRLHDAYRRGNAAWGRNGVAITEMGDLPVTLYSGELFDNNLGVIVPRRPEWVPAVWSFCSSGDFVKLVRAIDQKMNVTNSTLLKVPFDLERWQKVAADLYRDGLPEPYSNDPTQWLFTGDPAVSTDPLQVGIARLLGYRWPEQDALDELSDADGAVPIPAVAGEQAAAERLRAVLELAYGDRWSPALLRTLLDESDARDKDLEAWLRDSFFASHAKLFHNRPFIWHIWDGRKDGFGVLANYHRLDAKLLSRITYTLLGSWIELQRDGIRTKTPGAEGRLAAAEELQRKLMLIAEGEPPYDIYVRWKPLAEQPIGWDPDLNDGVRLNIRPFVTAGVLRSKFTINWSKDRGQDPDGSERVNDPHFTRAQKLAASEKTSTA